MGKESNTANQIDDYFRAMNEGSLSEKQTYCKLFSELTSMHKTVSRKDIIRGLVEKLETEKDVRVADIYRNMLEMMHPPTIE